MRLHNSSLSCRSNLSKSKKIISSCSLNTSLSSDRCPLLSIVEIELIVLPMISLGRVFVPFIRFVYTVSAARVILILTFGRMPLYRGARVSTKVSKNVKKLGAVNAIPYATDI